MKSCESARYSPRTAIEWVSGILVLFALALLLGQHWGMMLSNSDDPSIIRSTWDMNLQTASVQGRFWLIPINTLAAMPYRLGSWEAANAIKFLVNGSVFLSFVFFCVCLVNLPTGLFAGLVWLALIDVSPGYYSPFHGYLMMFNLQFAVMFMSFVWYLKILDGDRSKRTIIGPYVLFSFSLLAYEPMLFYAGVYPALFLFRYFSESRSHLQLRDWWQLLLLFLRRNWMLFLVVAAYIVTYFIYRRFQPTFGRGLDSSGSAIDIAITVYKFSVNGFHFQIKALTNYFEGISAPHNLVLAIVYATCIFVACYLLLPTIRDKKYPNLLCKKWSLAVLIFYVFCPNFLHGFVEGYRQWAAEDPHYVGNYFSAFPLAIVVSLGVLSLVGGRKAMQEKVLFFLVLSVLATSACDNYLRWGNLAETNRLDSKLWVQAIADLHKQSLTANGTTVVCGVHAPEKVSGDEVYWSGYLSELLGKSITYRYKNLSSVPCDIRLDFNQYRFIVARS